MLIVVLNVYETCAISQRLHFLYLYILFLLNFACTQETPKWLIRQTEYQDKMPYNTVFHQGLQRRATLFAINETIIREWRLILVEIITDDTLIYTINHPKFIGVYQAE